jgi:hypothetical protein
LKTVPPGIAYEVKVKLWPKGRPTRAFGVGAGISGMLVVESQGFPIGGLVASTQQAEVKLAKSTLATVKVPMKCGWRAGRLNVIGY